MSFQSLVILGSTGSIGTQTLDLVRLHSDVYKVNTLVAHSSVDLMYQQCKEFMPKFACLTDEKAASIYFAGGVAGFSKNGLITASGTGAGGSDNPGTPYKEVTASTTYKVFSKAGANATSAQNGFFISQADSNAGKTGYIVVEVCYIQPEEAPGYEDIDGYIAGRTVS